MTPETKFNVCTWNCNSIQKYKIELESFLIKFKIDICCLNETKINPNQKLFFNNYVVHRDDRNQHGGGVAILIKNSVKHFLQPKVTNVMQKHVIVNIETNNNHSFSLIALYNPPNSVLQTSDLHKLFNIHKHVILIGDLNAKHITWNCPINNKSGKNILEFTNLKNIIIYAPDEPTHYPTYLNARPSVIDIALIKNIRHFSKPISLSYLTGAHNPVLFEYNNDMIAYQPKTIPDFKNANWTVFNDFFSEKITNSSPEINTKEQLENVVFKFIKLVKKAIRLAVPQIPAFKYNTKIPEEISTLIKHKNRFRRLYQKHRNPQNMAKYHIFQYLVNRKLFQMRNNNWNKTLTQLSPKTGNLWRIKKIITKTNSNIPPLKDHNNTPIYTDEGKAELLAKHYESIHRATSNLGNRHHNNLVNKAVNSFMQNNYNNNEYEECNIDEILLYIKTLKNKKAPGIDKIPNFVLKKLPTKAIELLTHIINHILKLSHFPSILKAAKIIPIPKPGKPLDLPVNYRPISLLSGISKIVEKVIKIRINMFMDEHKVMNDVQFGFRSNHSTTAQLVRICDSTTHAFNIKKYTGLMLFDIEKAFDTMWHNGLLHKMIAKNFPIYIIKIIKSYLSNRIFTVFINNSFSTEKIFNCGVPQGSILGLVLYTIFISDIPIEKNTELALYADDTNSYTRSWRLKTVTNRLSKSAIRVEKHFFKWKTKLNNTKTEAILLTRRRPKQIPELKIGNKIIAWKTTVKYLGLKLDNKLYFTEHIKYVCNKALLAMSQLYPLFNKQNYLSTYNKLILYKLCIRPILTYAAPVWSNTSNSNIQALQVVQNKCLRIIGKYPRWTLIEKMHTDLGIPPIKEFVHKLTKNFFNKCAFNDNNLIKELGNYSLQTLNYKKYKHKRTKHVLL